MRALLATRLGGKADGLTAALAAHVAAVAPAFDTGDLLRMLRALEEAEEPIRRGANARLAIETLLVRWTLMDRTIQIAELLSGQSTGKLPDGKLRGGPQTPVMSDPNSAAPPPRVAETAAPVAPPAPAAAPRPAPGAPLTLETVSALWPEVVAAARNEKPLVANALEDSEPAALDGAVIRLRPLGGNPLTSEGLTRNRPVIEAIAGRVLGTPVTVVVAARSTGPAGAEQRGPAATSQGAPTTPPRLTASGAKAERLKALRKRDPSLDSAIDSLDLDLLD